MQITPLEVGLAVAAVTVVFGPKKLPSFSGNKQQKVVTAEHLAFSDDLSAEYRNVTFAAGRAMSPLQARNIDKTAHQFAVEGSSRPAPLPHELLNF